MFASAGLCVGLGVWGCQYRELQPVFFGGGRILGAGSTARPTNPSGGDDGHDDDLERGEGGPSGEDEDVGYSRGRGRGRGRDGAGEYEMAKMDPAS